MIVLNIFSAGRFTTRYFNFSQITFWYSYMKSFCTDVPLVIQLKTDNALQNTIALT